MLCGVPCFASNVSAIGLILMLHRPHVCDAIGHEHLVLFALEARKDVALEAVRQETLLFGTGLEGFETYLKT